MNEERILYTSARVRQKIIDLFSTSRGRRVAITAFVGTGADAYLPQPDGIELICWPKAGGTNPSMLRRLIKKGVHVSFVDSLHMKVYWTEDKGAVITSANLSTNALGAGNLREIGVCLPPGRLKIDKLLASLKCREASDRELRRLDREHLAYEMGYRSGRSLVQAGTFSEWYNLPHRPAWKLGWWDGDGDFSSAALQKAQQEYGLRAPHEFIACQQGNYSKSDWVLTFFLKRETPSQSAWLPVDYVVRVPRSDKVYESEYPYQAIQVWPISRYPAPPFRIDKKFRLAFSRVVKEYGADTIKGWSSVKPSKRFVDSINGHL